MKKSLNRLLFAWRYAIKNFIFNPMRSFLLTVGFLGIFVVVILAFSMNEFFNTYYMNKLEEKYQSFDLMMNVSASGDARFFSISQMNLNEDLNEMIEDKAVFFEFDVLLETQLEDRVYVHVFSSSEEDFSKISNVGDPNFQLEEDEMIITSSFAKLYDLEINDEVSLFAKSSEKSFVIIDIIEDGHLFIENSIFIDKDESISFFLSSLSPSLETLPSILLKNIYNSVYVDINPDYTYEQVLDQIQSISQYENLEINETIDQKTIDQFVSRNISVFSMMLSVVFVSILFVLQTTLLVYFNEKKGVFSQVNILGGKKQFSLGLVVIEMLLFFMISFILAILTTNIILDYGIHYLNGNLVYDIKFLSILYAFITVFVLTGVMVFYYFKSFYQVSDINHLKEQGVEVRFSFKKKFIILASSLIGYLLLEISFINQLLIGYGVVIKIVLAIVFMFALTAILLRLLMLYLDKRKNKNVLFYHFSMLLSKKAFKHYASVILIAFLTIMLLVFANGYMVQRASSYENAYQTDFILTHIVSNYDEVYEEINQLENVEHAERIGLFDSVYVTRYEQTIGQLISINHTQIKYFFNLEIELSALDNFIEDPDLKIILPDRYEKLYDLEIGDQILIYVNPTYEELSFEISGFFEKQLGDLAFTNMHFVYDDEDVYQSILVNASNDKTLLREQLLDLYSDQMIRILDVNQTLTNILFEMRRVTVYITFILSLIIGCFIIAMMNHAHLLFIQVKSNYIRLFVIGYSKKKMIITLIKEGILLLCVFFITSTIGYIAVASNFADLGVLFGEYEPIKFSVTPILYGSIIITLVFGIQYAIYIYQVLHIRVSEVIKAY
ncbi:ABC transporter permease family protein [Mariniplasma anaerobium]|uniref:Permease n=1 Tax=Mariniplasma anaerobium TaxID=2735436 RepID=A0A7U9XWN9_9MOLU|nr:hypothetical protein [Mariniplasma anaerobium]BCR36624.1 permease [Mariniplasma anaerobium]